MLVGGGGKSCYHLKQTEERREGAGLWKVYNRFCDVNLEGVLGRRACGGRM